MSGGVYLGFDFGGKRIGVAVGDGLTRRARGLVTISLDWTRIDALLREWAPAACVVGLPVGEDGQEQPITPRVRAFAEELGRRSGRPVHFCDERYSSLSAMTELRAARASGRQNRRLRSGDEDREAARLILEQWLAEQGADAT